MPKATYNETLDSIEAAPTPEVLDPAMRDNTRKDWAKAVRVLYKTLGVKGVSVTAPNYSMASSIHIQISVDDGHEHTGGVEYTNCLICKRYGKAKAKLEALVLAAYPDLDDRSDSMTDYFNFCLMVG